MLLRRSLICLIALLNVVAAAAQTAPLHKKVNPFIGTGGHGHTYPGASVPFGMMQLSPDTRLEGWDGCSGYHYSDSLIYGFSHTHLSGTGIADYCDVLLMPFTGEVQWKNSKYASAFSHKNEEAHPGYYAVLLDKHQIKAELTTAIRSGIQRYHFPGKTTEGKVLIDLLHRDLVLASSLEMVNAYEIKGMRRSRSWAQNQVLYFYIKFDKPITNFLMAINDSARAGVQKAEGRNLKAALSFALDADAMLQCKTGISGVSTENAKANLDAEIGGWEFETVKANAEKAWDETLSKITVQGGTDNEQTVFYTALYHASLSPNVYTDVNGEYLGTDKKVHQAKGFTNYTVFSLWDTYRAFHPLMSIIDKKRTGDWVNTFLAQYQQGGMLPVWELSANETFCMIGYHSVPVITDAWFKGVRNFDSNLALEAMRSYAESNRFGLDAYRQYGFVSNDKDHESASKTVEYAYDDWCIAQFARAQKNGIAYKEYIDRAQYYKNLYDPTSGNIRGKVQAAFYSPFDAREVNNFFTEGNSWHYSFAAPQDISGLIRLHGGKPQFAKKLNEMFTIPSVLTGRDQSDVTGLIGQYAQGNEPSHHMAYLFNYANQPWRTQELVHQVCKEFYKNDPDGLIGNEDCGQMSAWFLFSAMGFYPVTPATNMYAIGTPAFDKASMRLESGRTFTVKAKNRSDKNFYVQSLLWNGKAYTKSFITQDMIDAGGVLEFILGPAPNKNFGVKEQDIPASAIKDAPFVPVPFIDIATNRIADKIKVQIKNVDPKATIYYSLKTKTDTTGVFRKYTAPFYISSAATLQAYAQVSTVKSKTVLQPFFKIPDDRSIEVFSSVHPMYTAGGSEALIDGVIGTANWRTGEWQSYFGKDFYALIDFKRPKKLRYVAVHVLQDVSPWIIYPSSVIFETSEDGKTFTPLLTATDDSPKENTDPTVKDMGGAVNVTTRYLRVRAKNGGRLPAWHESAGEPSHIFIDEVIAK